MSNQIADMVKVRRNLERIFADHRLKIQQFVILPGADESGPHSCVAILRTDETISNESRNTDVAFQQMVEAEKTADRADQLRELQDSKLQAAETDLQEIEKDLRGKGIL